MPSRNQFVNFLLVGCACFPGALSAAPQQNDLPRLQIDERPSPLERVKQLSDSDDDRARSLAFFGQGRILFQHEEYRAALRAYQRAYQWNPESTKVLDEIVPLAFYLERLGPATRYAVLAAENGVDLGEPGLLRQLGQYLIQGEEIERALGLYKQAIKQLEDKTVDAEFAAIHMEAARLCYVLDEYKQGARSLEYVVDAIDHPQRYGLTPEQRRRLTGEGSSTYLLMGETFLEAGRLGRARDMFDRVHDIAPNDRILPFHYARLAFIAHDHQEALRQLNKYFDAKSTTADQAPYQLLEKVMRAANTTDADATFAKRIDELRRDNPQNPALTRFVARRQAEAGQDQKALQTYSELLKLPTTFDDYTAIVRAAQKLNKPEPILTVLGRLVAQTGNIDFLGDEKKQLCEDKPLVDRLIKNTLQPQRPDAVPAEQAYAAGLVAMYAKRFDDADKCLEKSLASTQARQERLIAWGLELFLMDQNERAAATFLRVLSTNPPENSTGINYYLATAQEMSGKTDMALKTIDNAIREQPDSLLLLNRKGWIFYHSKQLAEAENLFRELVKRFDSEQSADDYVKEARFSLSNLCLEQKRVDEAIEWLEQVLDDYPEDAGALNDLGYLLADENKHLHRALRMVRIATKKEPENLAYLDSLGWALFRVGRHEEAVVYLEQATKTESPDGVVLDHLGDAYLELNRIDDATKVWQLAVTALNRADETELREKIAAKIAKYRAER